MFGVADSEGALLENNSCSCCGANNECAESHESGVAVAGLGRILAYIGNDGLPTRIATGQKCLKVRTA